ncbi:MAG: hypothetical protein ACFFDJ_07425 [Candidatus Odinarchaeota archaeon]
MVRGKPSLCAICSRPIERLEELRHVQHAGKHFYAHGICLVRLRRLACKLFEISAPVPTIIRPLTLNEFLLAKRPRTDIEIVCCVAYYQQQYMSEKKSLTADFIENQLRFSAYKVANVAQALQKATANYSYFTQSYRIDKEEFMLTDQGVRIVKDLPEIND